MIKSVVLKILYLLIFSVSFLNAQGVSDNGFYHKLKDYNLAVVINTDSITDDIGEKFLRPEILGFMGENYQRFYIHFTYFTKSDSNPYVYDVKGKTKVKDNICNFTGTVKVISAVYDDDPEMMDLTEFKAGIITSKIQIFEDKLQNGSGVINGILITDVIFDDKGKLQYNAIMSVADGYCNNQFTGSWESYKTGIIKKCNWGDFRIPESDELDGGTGAFTVSEEYVVYGWESYRLLYCCGYENPESIEATKKEFEHWWE